MVVSADTAGADGNWCVLLFQETSPLPEEMKKQPDRMDKISIQISERITISTQLSEMEVAQIEDVEKQEMEKGGYVWYRLPVVEVDAHRSASAARCTRRQTRPVELHVGPS